jgi:hypothetical protein
MKRYVLGLVTGCIAAAAVAFFLRSSNAQAQPPGWGVRGAGEAGLVEETITFRALGGELRKQAASRVAVKVPGAYGQLTNITEGAETQTLWFVDPKGVVRNVVIGRNLVAIQIEN